MPDIIEGYKPSINTENKWPAEKEEEEAVVCSPKLVFIYLCRAIIVGQGKRKSHCCGDNGTQR